MNILNALEIKLSEQILSSSFFNVKDWQNFIKVFQEHAPYFILQLRRFNLTVAEEKVVILLKLNLRNDEIASLLNVKRESIYKYKFRIKQKLKLEESTPLSEFIKTL